MKFHYKYRTTAFELWQLSMYYTYGSMVGVCNIIFTAAVVVLGVSRWAEFGVGMHALIVLCALLFTVIQPLMVYRKALKQAEAIKEDTEAGFDDAGIHIRVGSQTADLKWSGIKKISKKPTMIIIFSDTTHGFVFTNRVLGAEREAFYAYVTSKMNR